MSCWPDERHTWHDNTPCGQECSKEEVGRAGDARVDIRFTVALAAELRGAGGQAEAVELDATDEPPVVDHLDEVARAVGSVEVSLNLVSRGDVQGMQREDLTAVDPNAPTVEQLHAMISGMALLRRAPKAREIADVAAFLASDRASGMTTGIANVTCGLVTG